jgi:hypothetical protein
MLKCSNPSFQSSTELGRTLLEWYINFENYVCILFPSKQFLPRRWREERCRYYDQFNPVDGSESPLEPHIQLEKLWAQYYPMLLDYLDIHASSANFPSISESEKPSQVNSLLNQWREIYAKFDNFRISIERLDIFQPDRNRAHIQAYSSTGRLPPPFVPYCPKYPPAGLLRHIILGVQIHSRLIMYAPLRRYDEHVEEKSYDETGWLAYEICRTFAGLEAAAAHNTDELIPAFPALTMACFGCRRMDIRLWLWRKLAHYEELMQMGYQPIRNRLAIFWGMPELLTLRFEAWQTNPPEQARIVQSEDIQTIVDDAKATLESDAESPELLAAQAEEEDDF